MKANTAPILIVDDEPMVVNALLRTLSVNKIAAVGAAGPQEALERLRERQYAAIISDQRMPGMTGVELLLEVRRLSPATVRILITGYTDIDVVISAINNGQIFYYIAKPWTEKELLAVVGRAMTLYAQEAEKARIVEQMLHSKDEWKALTAELSDKFDRSLTNAVSTLKKIMEVRDPELLQHSLRVSRCAGRLATMMGLPPARRVSLEYAGIFHDIGKIAIRDKILYKSDRLDEDEYKAMKLHPVYGADILRELGFFDEVAEIVLQHHEKFDGTGYPRGLKGQDILPEARIIAVADAYDSLVSTRVYRNGQSPAQALSVLTADSGSHFDPYVVELLGGLERLRAADAEKALTAPAEGGEHIA